MKRQSLAERIYVEAYVHDLERRAEKLRDRALNARLDGYTDLAAVYDRNAERHETRARLARLDASPITHRQKEPKR